MTALKDLIPLARTIDPAWRHDALDLVRSAMAVEAGFADSIRTPGRTALLSARSSIKAKGPRSDSDAAIVQVVDAVLAFEAARATRGPA